MRERKTEVAAKELVSKLIDSGDIIEFVEQCMQTATWYGKYSGRNRFMFQNAVKKELKFNDFHKENKRDELRRLACSP